jgi:hypothetical protein
MGVIIEAVSKNKVGLKIDGAWTGCSPAVGGFVKVGQQYEIENQAPDGTITRVSPVGGYQKPQGGYQKPQGGYQKPAGGYQKPAAAPAKKDWVDNSLGQSVGAAMNNAVALYIAGKIEESQIPQAAVALYLTSEGIKEAAPNKDFSSVGVGFKLTGAVKAAAPKAQASAPAQPDPAFDMGGDDCPFDN